MSAFTSLLRDNRNYRYTWIGQIVSEVGDHFNNIAVFSLAMKMTGSGLVVSGVLLARGLAVLLAGPIAGVALDRYDRRNLMIASDLFRAVMAAGFSLCLLYPSVTLLYVLSASLMFASPFFTSGRAAILPTIASKQQLHTANSLTQTTQWTTLALGTFMGGTSVMQFGYEWAFVFNTMSFVISALCISRLRAPHGFRVAPEALTEQRVVRPWHEYREGLRYLRSVPLLFGLALVGVGWATGGGAAQVLFTMFGEKVFNRGPAGIGEVWGAAAIGLLAGGTLAHRYGLKLKFSAYKWAISICYVIHGGAYVVFSQMENYPAALFFIGLSRAAVGFTSVLNMTQLLRHVSDQFRGRVFSTMETLTWATMMLSMTAAGLASDYFSIRTVGALSGILSSSTALWWAWAHMTGRLPEPPTVGVERDEVEVHGDPNV
ncbi:MAG: MFS transporter [Bryobacterales bacterium]|nr:MFS transporter [Bryobacterales bacterium]